MEEIINLKVNQQKNKRNLEQYAQKQKTSFQSIKPIERDNYLNEEKKMNSSFFHQYSEVIATIWLPAANFFSNKQEIILLEISKLSQ